MKTSVKVVEHIKENPEITIPELAEQLERTTRAIEMQIASLKEKGILKRVGPDKGGHWEIIDH